MRSNHVHEERARTRDKPEPLPFYPFDLLVVHFPWQCFCCWYSLTTHITGTSTCGSSNFTICTLSVRETRNAPGEILSYQTMLIYIVFLQLENRSKVNNWSRFAMSKFTHAACNILWHAHTAQQRELDDGSFIHCMIPLLYKPIITRYHIGETWNRTTVIHRT